MLKATLLIAALAAAFAATATAAPTVSTSATSPTPLPQDGVISGAYPGGAAETAYYFASDLKAGELVTQISFLGRPERDKKLELELLNAKGRSVASYAIMSGLDANQEAARVFPVDDSGPYTVRIGLTGPETTTYKVQLGGSALSRPNPAPSPAGGAFSESFLAPGALPKDGVITGKFPGGDRRSTLYYFETSLKAGDLLSQISFSGRPTAPKWMELALLRPNGREVKSYYVLSSLEGKQEATRSLPVDDSGRYVVRVSVKGAEATTFRVDLGGSAFVGQ